MSYLLVDKDGMRDTLKFVTATNRLQALPGEGPNMN